jgi:nucleoside-diphosphate-sugar epimerase
MAKVLIVGCGDLGTAIAENLQKNHEVIGLRRNIHAPASHAISGGIKTIFADVTLPDSLTQLEKLSLNIVIYCVSAGGQSDAQYQAAYVTGLKNILATQANNQVLQHVFFVSSTRVYGQVTDDLLDETTLAIPADFGGERLFEAENLLKGMPCKATSMRLSGIYGTGRLYLVNMSKDVSKWPAENHWSNRIHRDDAAAFIAFMVEKAIKKEQVEDTYIVTDDMPTQQYQVLTWLAQQHNVDTSNVKTPAVLGGKRLSNQRLRDTGFVLQYPNYQAGYAEILKAL